MMRVDCISTMKARAQQEWIMSRGSGVIFASVSQTLGNNCRQLHNIKDPGHQRATCSLGKLYFDVFIDLLSWLGTLFTVGGRHLPIDKVNLEMLPRIVLGKTIGSDYTYLRYLDTWVGNLPSRFLQGMKIQLRTISLLYQSECDAWLPAITPEGLIQP